MFHQIWDPNLKLLLSLSWTPSLRELKWNQIKEAIPPGIYNKIVYQFQNKAEISQPIR